MRQVLFAGKEPQEWPSHQRFMIADSPTQHGITSFECIEHRANGDWRRNFQRDNAIDAREVAQMIGNLYAYRVGRIRHTQASVCTSTDSTAGKSCTIAFHESPPSGETYTWPPVVPKYTPHLSSLSTAMASRSTFT